MEIYASNKKLGLIRPVIQCTITILFKFVFQNFTATRPITVWRKMAYNETDSPQVVTSGTSHKGGVAGPVLV